MSWQMYSSWCISDAASAIYPLQCENGSVSGENQTRTVTDKVRTAGLYLLKVLFMLIVSFLASGSIFSAIASFYQPTGRPISVLFDGEIVMEPFKFIVPGNSNISKPTIYMALWICTVCSISSELKMELAEEYVFMTLGVLDGVKTLFMENAQTMSIYIDSCSHKKSLFPGTL